MEGGSALSSRSISSPTSFVLGLLPPFRLTLKRVWFRDGPQRAETLLSMSLHMSANIHKFFLASRAFGLGMALRRAAKNISSLFEVVGERMGIFVHRPRYLVCSLRRSMWRYTRNM